MVLPPLFCGPAAYRIWSVARPPFRRCRRNQPPLGILSPTDECVLEDMDDGWEEQQGLRRALVEDMLRMFEGAVSRFGDGLGGVHYRGMVLPGTSP